MRCKKYNYNFSGFFSDCLVFDSETRTLFVLIDDGEIEDGDFVYKSSGMTNKREKIMQGATKKRKGI